jgi:hypothetical protein
MTKTTTVHLRLATLLVAVFLGSAAAIAFHSGHTGATEAQLKSACPAFAQGEITLADSVSPPGNLPLQDMFEHESGARCACMRSRTDKQSLKCGPTAAATPRR